MLLLVFCSLTSWIPLPKQEVAMLVMEVSGVNARYCLLLLLFFCLVCLFFFCLVFLVCLFVCFFLSSLLL